MTRTHSILAALLAVVMALSGCSIVTMQTVSGSRPAWEKPTCTASAAPILLDLIVPVGMLAGATALVDSSSGNNNGIQLNEGLAFTLIGVFVLYTVSVFVGHGRRSDCVQAIDKWADLTERERRELRQKHLDLRAKQLRDATKERERILEGTTGPCDTWRRLLHAAKSPGEKLELIKKRPSHCE